MGDFVHRFASEDEISTFVKAIPDIGARAGVETSRLHQAWVAARTTSLAAESKERKGVDDRDLDALLPAPDLPEITAGFYNRYKLRFPLHVEPCDQMVSRHVREVSRRARSRKPAPRISRCSLLPGASTCQVLAFARC